jgi:ABC-2 type transport system ATP-binding protein
MPEDPPAVAVEGLTKRFGTGPAAVTAVDGVSFDIAPGSVVGLLGPNGAGKTTTIKSILGLVVPDEGSVRVHGVDVASSPRAVYGRVDAMLEGARNDYWRLTVRENLRYFAAVGGVVPDSVGARHDRLLERFDLADRADQPVRDLSRGMKQKVSLASVLAGDADVVFLDEPTLGLDVESSRTLRREVRRVVERRGLTAVVSSHDMDTVEELCDRVIVMSDGRVVADDAVDVLLDRFETRGVRVTGTGLDESTVAAVDDRFGVGAVDRYRGRTRVEVETDGDGLYDVLGLLRERGVSVDDVETVRPDLEEAFVELTGLDGESPTGDRSRDDVGERDRGAEAGRPVEDPADGHARAAETDGGRE